MTKNDYRTFFAQCKTMLKLNYFCKLVNISPVTLSRFMKGEAWDYEMSLDKCQKLYDAINDTIQNIA